MAGNVLSRRQYDHRKNDGEQPAGPLVGAPLADQYPVKYKDQDISADQRQSKLEEPDRIVSANVFVSAQNTQQRQQRERNQRQSSGPVFSLQESPAHQGESRKYDEGCDDREEANEIVHGSKRLIDQIHDQRTGGKKQKKYACHGAERKGEEQQDTMFSWRHSCDPKVFSGRGESPWCNISGR